MITYKAMFKFDDGQVHAHILDFPGANTCGKDLDEARRMVGVALVDMAETLILLGRPLPTPDPSLSDPDSDLEEPVHLVLLGSSQVVSLPAELVH